MYILVAFDGRDLTKVDGAPFDLRFNNSNISDEELTSYLNQENNKILFLGEDLFKRVRRLIHLPIRKENYSDCLGIRVLTLSNGCKVKFMNDWNIGVGSHLFRNEMIKDAVPSYPNSNIIISDFELAKKILIELIELPYGHIFGFDYETSGLVNKNPDQENYIYRKWQGRDSVYSSYQGSTFQVTGASICTEESHSYYFDFLTLVNGVDGMEFLSLMDNFLTKHSFNCWVYNSNFETQVSLFVFNKFYIFNDASVINFIDGRNKKRTSLKFTVQRVLRLRSWDDAFDDLNQELSNLLTDSYQVNWDEGTVVCDGLTYVWYKSPKFTEIFEKYGSDVVEEAKDLASRSFMNPFLCIPPSILGTYCNIDSYVTMELARYIKSTYSTECIEVFTSNLRFHVYLGISGNFIDTQELKRQKLLASSASNWGMICLYQFVTDIEIKEFREAHDLDTLTEVTKGSEIFNWCLMNNISYTDNKVEMLQRIINHCYDYNSEWQVNINRLREAFPWEYSYDAIYDQIVAWGGLDEIHRNRGRKKFWNGNAWIISEYGSYDADAIDKLNKLIYWKQLNRKSEWCKYLTRLFPSWDSLSSIKYITLQGAYSNAISNYISSDGKPWYESDEIYNISFPDTYEVPEMGVGYVDVLNLPDYSTDPVHHFIAGMINCGAPSGMEWMKNWFISYLDVWKDILLLTFIGNDNEYILGYEFWESLDMSTPDVWSKAEGKKINPMRITYDVDGNPMECFPVLDEFGFTEIGELVDSPFGKILKAVNTRDEKGNGLNRDQFLEKCGFDVMMIELGWEGHIGERYKYTETLTSDILIPLVDSWWKRGVRGYKDFMEVIVTHIGKYEMHTIGTQPWNWDDINSTKVDTSNKLHQMKIILGLYTWRKFRKVLGTYLNSLLVEGARYSETYDKKSVPVYTEYEIDEWKEGWDIMRGHPNWKCMGVHTKRWSCLVGDTPILMLDGRTLPIKELDKEIGNYVYSLDVDTNHFRPGKILNWGVTGKNAPIYKVKFDTGLEIRCTDNHKFLRSNRTYVECKDMKVNDSIYPVKIKSDGNGEKLHTGEKWHYTVNTLYHELMPNNSTHQYHHKDKNKFNNRPDNVEILSNYAHQAIHGSDLGVNYGGKSTPFRNSEWQSEMGRRKKPGTSLAMRQPGFAAKRRYDFCLFHDITIDLYKSGNLNETSYNSHRTHQGRKWIFWRNLVKFYGSEENIYKELSEYIGNSRVISIEFDGYEDVYDIEVDKYHNFAIGDRNVKIKSGRKNSAEFTEGIIVHNSGFHTLFGNSDTKKVITVPKDCLFFYLDISQAEPRTLAYKSGDPLMKSWYEEGKDIYIELAKLFNPQIVNATHLSDEEKRNRLIEERGLFKILVLAIMYGMGIASLSSMTGKPRKVAQKYKDEFFDAMPGLKTFIEGRMNYPKWENGPGVWTILGDYLELYPWDEYRWARQGINFCIQSFSALVLINGFENLVRTAINHNLIFSPIGTVHDSSQMIMDARFIYNCQAHFDVNYTGYLYKIHGIKYKGDIKIGTNYYDLSNLQIVNENTISLVGSATSITQILRNLKNAGVEDYELNVPIESLVPDMYSSIPKQVARTMGAGTISDKSKYKVEVTFKDDVINFHRSLVEGEAVKVITNDEFIDNSDSSVEEDE